MSKKNHKQWVYTFGDGKAEGDASMRNLLGGKGANLAEMCSLGLPVPPGITITTDACIAWFDNNEQYPPGMEEQLNDALNWMQKLLGAELGSQDNPLLVSVRSGARTSMPGMMDTILNLGLNDATVEALSEKTGGERFSLDSYRRFIQMFADVALGVEHHNFEEILEAYKDRNALYMDTDLDAAHWRAIIAAYKEKILAETKTPFPQDIQGQLHGAVRAVFKSWHNTRAVTYRRLHAIPDTWGTAVNIQAMVFGNRGDDSATGVAFTRDPSTGENKLYGEFLVNAQGEDVVAGIRTPRRLCAGGDDDTGDSMQESMPGAFDELAAVCSRLEKHYRDMQDIEFTVQEGKLWMLQTRAGKRSARAAVKIAVDMVGETLISKQEAVGRIQPDSLTQLLHPTLDPDAPRDIIATGLPASPGAASGEITFSADDAEDLRRQERHAILVRIETSPEDIHGMHAADGILTTRGGMTSHAAVVARGMGRPCVCGAGGIHIDYTAQTLSAGDITLNKGDIITIDGSAGQIIRGHVPRLQPEFSGDFSTLMGWADGFRRLNIRTNAETPDDATTARQFGAEGIGLCRTEHMFFDQDRIQAVRCMILARDQESRQQALQQLLPAQRDDFTKLFRIMAGMPVTIRLLDPPLHEFLPRNDQDITALAEAAGMTPGEALRRVAELEEFNPMLGHRGCRLGITYPEIYEMQARAIFEAAIITGKDSEPVVPEIMIPLVAMHSEYLMLKEKISGVAERVKNETGTTPEWKLGTMIELPRACLRAGDIARDAEFFSFGTNDLTQTAFGISRDDAARFLADYADKKIISHDPFVSLDIAGVGELVEIAAQRGRDARKDLKIGLCGEHGGDPDSIQFCEKIKLDYVSCSPYRVPIARLAAAQAAISQDTQKA